MRNRGVTLVELSIVIVIIGILIGGVIAGADLIHQAKLDNVMAQIGSYNTALNTFYLKFKAIPGDFKNAHAFSLDNHTDDAGGGGKCCNDGNGNGFLESRDQEGNLAADLINGEVANFWTHLTNAQLIAGSYFADGCQGSSSCSVLAGVVYPTAKVGNGIAVLSASYNGHYTLNWIIGLNTSYSYNSDRDGDVSGRITDANSIAAFSLTAFDAYTIDTKMDDGVATSGTVQFFDQYNNGNSFIRSNPLTSTTCALPNGQYNVISQAQICSLWLRASGQGW